MKQINQTTGEIETFERFAAESSTRFPSAKQQRETLNRFLDLLTQQGDYWSLELLTNSASMLWKDSTKTGRERAANFYSILNNVLQQKPENDSVILTFLQHLK